MTDIHVAIATLVSKPADVCLFHKSEDYFLQGIIYGNAQPVHGFLLGLGLMVIFANTRLDVLPSISPQHDSLTAKMLMLCILANFTIFAEMEVNKIAERYYVSSQM